MAYNLQRVLPSNFQPPRVRGLGVGPPFSGPIISGDVPAYPVLLPTLDLFTVSHASRRPTRMIPSIMSRAPRPAVPGARIYPVSAAGVMPSAGLSAYMDSPTPWPLTATWGVGAYRPVSLAGLGSCGCPKEQGTCSCGMGDLDLGQVTLPVVGQVDIKSALLVVGGFLLARKILGMGRRATGRVRQYGVRAPIYRRVEA
jgi:hypothetical protein